MPRTRALPVVPAVVAVLCLTASAGCGESAESHDDPGVAGASITLVTHDSFAVSDDLFERFHDQTGITVEVLRSGDAGEAVNQAILTKDHPQGDVFFGVDNTFLTRALDEDLFVRHDAAGLGDVDPRFLLDAEHRVTPIDYGDVCLNYDKAWFDEHDVPVPQRLDDLVLEQYDGLLAVENPATSSPGLAFLIATIDRFGEDGWRDYWAGLRDNDVVVANGWEDAYYGEFSGGSGSEGERPLVVSYASSPPAEVVFADPPIDEAPIGVVEDGCFRQVEFAGVLAGTDEPEAAGRLIDFMLSRPFQEDMPLNMFVFPVTRSAALPEVFAAHAAQPAEPIEVAPEEIGAQRDDWIDEWTDTVLG